MSFSTIRRLLRDVLQITISRGQLAKLIRRANSALGGMIAVLELEPFVYK